MNAFDADKIRDAAVELAVSEGLIEKEWHAVHVIELVHQLDLPGMSAVFAGGTSLSAAFNLTERFSEDVDFKLRKTVGRSGPAGVPDVERLCNALRAAAGVAGYSEIGELFHRDDRFGFHRLCFTYEPEFDRPEGIRPHIQVEITPMDEGASDPEVTSVFTRISRLAQESPDITDVPCVQVVDTAADKISALTWRVLARDRRAPNDDPTLVRHIYDIAAMPDDVLNSGRLRNLSVQQLRKDAGQSRSQGRVDRLYPVNSVREMRALLSSDPEYAVEYDRYVMNMFFGVEPPAFNDVLTRIDRLIEQLDR